MAIIKIKNPAIDLDAAEIPNIDASKITTGSLGADRIPSLAASKIGSGTFADARIAASKEVEFYISITAPSHWLKIGKYKHHLKWVLLLLTKTKQELTL